MNDVIEIDMTALEVLIRVFFRKNIFDCFVNLIIFSGSDGNFKQVFVNNSINYKQ